MRPSPIAFLCLVSLLIHSTTLAQPYEPDTSTIALYHLDDIEGTSAVDASENALSAAVFGATWTTEGRFGGGITLDGDDYLGNTRKCIVGVC